MTDKFRIFHWLIVSVFSHDRGMTAENRWYIKGTKTALNTIMFFLLFKKKMVAKFPVISREEILNFVKKSN